MCLILRRRAGFTQAQVAKKIGCCPFWVRQMELGLIDDLKLYEFWSHPDQKLFTSTLLKAA